MIYTVEDEKTGGLLRLYKGASAIDSPYFKRNHNNRFFVLAWNTGNRQSVSIDGKKHPLKKHTILPLMFNQTFEFQKPEDVVVWQFNREYYCIIDNDAEVSCVGFLFTAGDNLFIELEKEEQEHFDLILKMFISEMMVDDSIKREMLLALLKRLIVNVTRVAKNEKVSPRLSDDKFNLIRMFNLLVEAHFHKEHAVSFYAKLLNKSPKTLANVFTMNKSKSPSQIIQERIIIEAKRLLSYTHKSTKEITYELGFEDAAYFSAYFKKYTRLSPSDFKKAALAGNKGK